MNLSSAGLFAEFVLFGEDASRILVSCDPENLPRIKQVAAKHSVSADVIGETISEKLVITVDGNTLVSASVSELADVHARVPWKRLLKTDPELLNV